MVYGSLHFMTFDGLQYSFWALGEFVLVRLSSELGSNIFTLQGEIGRLQQSGGQPTQVPVLVRMAAYYQGIGKVSLCVCVCVCVSTSKWLIVFVQLAAKKTQQGYILKQLLAIAMHVFVCMCV